VVLGDRPRVVGEDDRAAGERALQPAGTASPEMARTTQTEWRQAFTTPSVHAGQGDCQGEGALHGVKAAGSGPGSIPGVC